MVRYTEFQAVLLAGGKGSRMTELTAGKPKCLLPIGNMPMIWYPLRILERAGFSEAIVVVTENIKNDVATCVDKLGLGMRLELVGIPAGEDWGTADSMRHIYDKIHHDFIVISCDLIADIDISELVNSYRKHRASISALMLPVPKIPNDFVTPGPKSKQRPETDLIGIDNRTDRLVFLASASDFEETLNVSRKLLKKHNSFTIFSGLMDAHLYIINKWVLNFLVHNKNLSTLKGELLPYIVSKQLSRPPKQMADDKNASVVNENLLREDIYRFAIEKPIDELIRKMSAFNDHNTDLEDAYHGDAIRCYAHRITGKFGLRANTVQMYALANKMLSELWSDGESSEASLPPQISLNAIVKSNQVENCRIDEGALVNEKTSLKQSHVGPSSIIESKTRIADTVVMGNVTVGQRCIIQNCILCNGCVIEEGTELKDCLVGAQHIVNANSRHSREVLTDADRLMEI